MGHRVVWVQGRHSHLLEGDSLDATLTDGVILPELLRRGWEIVTSSSTQNGVYFVLKSTDSAPRDAPPTGRSA